MNQPENTSSKIHGDQGDTGERVDAGERVDTGFRPPDKQLQEIAFTGKSQQVLVADVLDQGNSHSVVEVLNLRIARQSLRSSWRAGIDRLIEQMDRGATFEQAVDRCSEKFKPELRALLDAALQMPDPTKFLVDIALLAPESSVIRWQIRSRCVYALVMLAGTASVCLVVTQVLYGLMTDGISDFGLAGFSQVMHQIQDQRAALISLLLVILWIILAAITISVVGPKWAIQTVSGGLPLIGRPLRWLGLYELLSRIACVSGQRHGSVEVARVVALSFRGSPYEIVATRLEQRAQSGSSLGIALSKSQLGDSSCMPLLLSLDNSNNQTVQCDKLAQVFLAMIKSRSRVIAGMFPLLILVTMGTLIWGTISTYLLILMLLIRMISSLA